MRLWHSSTTSSCKCSGSCIVHQTGTFENDRIGTCAGGDGAAADGDMVCAFMRASKVLSACQDAVKFSGGAPTTPLQQYCCLPLPCATMTERHNLAMIGVAGCGLPGASSSPSPPAWYHNVTRCLLLKHISLAASKWWDQRRSRKGQALPERTPADTSDLVDYSSAKQRCGDPSSMQDRWFSTCP